MLEVNGTTIRLTRGDTAALVVSLMYDTGAEYDLNANSHVIFRLKTSPSAADMLIEKELNISTEDNTAVLSLSPEDTEALNFSTYRYEIELITESDQHYTVICNSNFEVLPELEVHE